MSADFVHLHVHTQYSLLDGALKLPDLFAKAKADGMPAVAITDHGNMHGVIQFVNHAKAAGVQPILGCEVYVAHGSRHDKSNAQPPAYHLILLAETEVGYHNLIKIVSTAHLEGAMSGLFGRPRCDRETLQRYNEGLIAMSACLQGELARTALAQGLDKAVEVADWYRQVFRDRYYIELQRNGIEEQNKANELLLQIAKILKLPAVATNDCHYLNREHARSHELLLCLQTGKTIKDENRFRFSTDEIHFRTREEMAEVFADHPELLTRTREVAERCNFKLSFGKTLFPALDVPPGETPATMLAQHARAGLAKRLERIKSELKPENGSWEEIQKRYIDRLETEIDLINQKGFASYFLIVEDFIGWAKDHQVPVGPGRGSAAGSLVSYALRITNIDPIRYNLLFERFLNPERQDNPDIDIDFCAERRDEVLQYVTEKYGKECVAQIAAFGSMKARAVIRDVGRVLGHSFGEIDQVAKLVPDEPNMTLEKAEKDPDIQRLLKESEWVRELWFHARALEGLARHASTHAAGVIIADRPLVECAPLMHDHEGKLITQFDKNDVEKIGLIKFDFLGLKTLTVIDKALKIIREVNGVEVDIDHIPMDDPAVYALLGKGLSTGIFQFESAGMRELLVRLHPDSVEDLTAIAALFRPGPIGSGMIDDFVARKKGQAEVTYDLPELEPILKTTYGMMVYQEQVQQVAHLIGGFSLGEADLMRRAMAKKKADQMEPFRIKFFERTKDSGYARDRIERIWKMMEKFAEYGFNKSHSAAYAVVAYQTAWLKTHYPAAFMAALMTMDKGESDKIMAKIVECRDLDIAVLPPDVNESDLDFSVNKAGQIRFGLAAVKNVGEGAVRSIIEARQKGGPFKGLFDFTGRIDPRKVNKRVLESLVKCGAFDSIEKNRAALFAAIESALDRAAHDQADREAGQVNMFDLLGAKSGAKSEPILPDVPAWTKEEHLRFEKEALGFFITGHPLDQFRKLIERYSTCTADKLRGLSEPENVQIAAVITGLEKKITKTGKPMAVGLAEDQSSPFKITMFSESLETNKEALENLDQPFLLTGKADIREGGNGLLVDKIIPLVQADKVCSNEVHFRLRSTGLAKTQIERLKACLVRHPGSCRTFVHMLIPDRAEVIFSLPVRLGVQPSDELVDEVRAIFGAGVVTFQ